MRRKKMRRKKRNKEEEEEKKMKTTHSPKHLGRNLKSLITTQPCLSFQKASTHPCSNLSHTARSKTNVINTWGLLRKRQSSTFPERPD